EAVGLRSLERSPNPRRILEGDTEFFATRRCDRRGRRGIELRYGPAHAARGLHLYHRGFCLGSIGYATPALLGAILASPGRRHILLTGEGSLQTTAQELSTVMRHDLKPFIFVINNSGYTVERAVLGKDAKYNDVANWRYSELPNVFSRDAKAETYVV